MTDTMHRNGHVRAAVGSTGLTHWAGQIDTEWDRRLRGKKGPQTYREMSESSPTIGALLFAFESLVRGAGHRIEPADESEPAQDAATFVEECISDLEGAWGDTLAEVLTALPFGFSLLELIYKQRSGPTADAAESSAFDDGRIGWARWSPRAQETIESWLFDEHGAATHAVQNAPPQYRKVEIPLNRCLHVRVRARRNSPEGLSILRNAYDAWYFYKHIQRIEGIGIERDLAGLPMLRIPSEVMNDPQYASDYTSYQRIVTNIRKDEQAGIILPSDTDESGTYTYDFALLSTGGTRQVDTDPVLARYERLMLRSVLADFITQGDTGVGSYAQSVNRTDLFLASVNAVLDSLGDAITTQAIRRLFAVNDLDLALCPTFVFNDVSRKDVAGFVSALVSLAGAGIVDTSEPDLKAHVYDLMDLPLPEVTDEQEAQDDGEEPDDEPTTDDEDETPPEPPEDARTASTRKQAVESADIDAAVDLFRRSVKPKWRGMLDAEVEDE